MLKIPFLQHRKLFVHYKDQSVSVFSEIIAESQKKKIRKYSLLAKLRLFYLTMLSSAMIISTLVDARNTSMEHGSMIVAGEDGNT